jgi:cysteine desulfurase / selenocysteine lyase
MPLDVDAIRRQFPLLRREPSLAYLDSAATSQKPDAVLDAVREYYETSVGAVHRSMHPLAERATEIYEGSREIVRGFLNARYADEIVFTKNATEAVNLAAHAWARRNLKKGDVILLSPLEHHSNIIPWMMLRQLLGVQIEWIGIDAEGGLDLSSLQRQLKKKETKLWAVTGLSNVLGNYPALSSLLMLARHEGIATLVDAAQLCAHAPIDVQELKCDFLALSSHKMYGPEGIGVLYGRRELLEQMPPFLGGGSMIREVRPTGFTPADSPQRFEAGSQPVSAAAGLAAAIRWSEQFPWEDRQAHEQVLLQAALDMLNDIPGITILGPANAEERLGCISFHAEWAHAHDIAEVLGSKGICVRAGNHCAQPLHEAFGIPASVRISIALHTTEEEVRRVGAALVEAKKLLGSGD